MRHEQIILVILGYVIGFSTAFIFIQSTSQPTHTPQRIESPDVNSYGLVANASINDGSEEHSTAITSATVTNEGLFVTVDGKERIVSAGAIAEDENIAGFHYAIPAYLISPNKDFLYYCAQSEPNDVECTSFVFSARTDSVYPVKNIATDTYVTSEVRQLFPEWTPENILKVNGIASVTNETPWLLE